MYVVPPHPRRLPHIPETRNSISVSAAGADKLPDACRCRRLLLLPPPQPAREAGHIVGMPVAEMETSSGVVVIEVGAPVSAAAAAPGGSDVEMQLMRPATGLADQEAIASATCLLDLKCWQDLPMEEAGVRDNRWLLSVQRSEGQPMPDGQTQA